jgi:hypothetical protein
LFFFTVTEERTGNPHITASEPWALMVHFLNDDKPCRPSPGP